MRKVQFTETVLRDANQSLMATRLPYADYADILPAMDKAGYYSIECWGGATFDSCLRYLNEDPWERLRNLRKNLPNNKLQMLLRGQNLLGYKHYHDDVVEKFIELSIKNGIDIIRIFDALNDFRQLRNRVECDHEVCHQEHHCLRLYLLYPESGAHRRKVCGNVQGAQAYGIPDHLPEGYGWHHDSV